MSLEQTGLFRKEFGLSEIEAHHGPFVQEARAIAQALGQAKGDVSIDDVRRVAAENGLVAPHPNCWGSTFDGPHWVRVRWVPSRNPTNNARMIPVWRWIP